MYVLDCIPIARSTPKESLSYLSKNKVAPGSIVEAPLRKQTIPALVLTCTKAENIKSTIRSSSFQLKKIRDTSPTQALLTPFIQAVGKTAEEFISYPGQILYLLTPKHVLTQTDVQNLTQTKKQKSRTDWKVLQASNEDRLAHYKKLIRESFSKKESVFISVPSIQDGERLHNFLKKGIENYTFLLHGSLTKKKLLETWHSAIETTHPLVIIGTPMFLSIPRTDITTILIEKESSEGYRTISNPRIDTRIFIEHLAQKMGIRLIFSDTLLRFSTLYRYKNSELSALQKPTLRHTSSAHNMLFDMTEENSPLIFNHHADKLIRRTKTNNEHTFVFAARKGLAPLTICQDCGHTVTASDGSSPMVLYEHPEGNYFYSPHTKEKRPADTTCSYCGGWRLKPLGLGIDTIEKELEKIAPDTTLFRLDRGSVSSHKKATAIVKEFYNTPGAILLGTEFAASYIEQVDHCIITTIDSQLSLPDFQIQEKTLRTLLSFREKAFKNFIVQTRSPDHPVFQHAISGTIEDMFTTEMESRKKFSFPPFSTLIKITLQGPEHTILKHAEEIVTYLDEAQADIYPAHISKVQGSHILNILLRIDSKQWPEHMLVDKLRAMQAQYKVQAHPEHIL